MIALDRGRNLPLFCFIPIGPLILTKISRYLNGSGYVSAEASEKIKKAIEEMNYIPSATAGSLSTRKSNLIGVVVPEAANPFFGEALEGISTIADNRDINIIYFHTDSDADKELRALLDLRTYDICGLIITPACGPKHSKDYVKNFQTAVYDLLCLVKVMLEIKTLNFMVRRERSILVSSLTSWSLMN